MATYQELFDLFQEPSLRNRIAVAVVVSAVAIAAEDPGTPNHAERIDWAARAATDPGDMAKIVLTLLLAINKDATVQQILGAPDTAIQTNVDSVVDLLAVGLM